MERLFVRWLLSAIAIAVVAWWLPGIEVGHGSRALVNIAVAAAILGLVNAIVRPILTLLSCPLVVLTLGLFLFVINAAMLILTSILSSMLGFPFHVATWGAALIGSIAITIVTWILSLFVHEA